MPRSILKLMHFAILVPSAAMEGRQGGHPVIDGSRKVLAEVATERGVVITPSDCSFQVQ